MHAPKGARKKCQVAKKTTTTTTTKKKTAELKLKEITILIVMSDRPNPELPPASQTGDDRREIEIEAIQETGADDDTSVVAYGQPDRESLHLLQSLSPRNSLRHNRNLRRIGEGEPVLNDHAVQDVNVAIATLSSSQEDSAQSNSGDRESTTSSNEEPERKPVEATDAPTGGTSALVPSSSPPKSPQYLDILMKTYVMVDNPSPAFVDPADQHRMQPIEGISY